MGGIEKVGSDTDILMTVQVRPCKYCFFWNPADMYIEGKEMGVCTHWSSVDKTYVMSETEYCSFGSKSGDKSKY